MSTSNYLGYALQRLAQALVVVALAYILTFLIINVLPGDPISNMLLDPENGFSRQDVAPIIAYYGLDKPISAQLWIALSRFVTGDLGISLRSSLPVSGLVLDALPSTLILAASALSVALVLAFLIALASQNLPRKYGQGLVRLLPAASLSIPSFIIGIFLIQVFAFQFGLFRITNPDTFAATAFAALALGVPVSAQIAEVLVTNLDHEARQEYFSVARSRSLSRIELFTYHQLRPSSLPLITMIALAVGELLGGSLVTEAIFGRSGIGSLVQGAVSMQDYPVIQAVVSLAATVFVAVNLLADLAYPLLDPRLRADRRGQTSLNEAEVAPE
ncbi:ABC transporter permease [Agrobacterium rhizogenes]|uniref:ABC transporter permease protein n=1 Tax=Rhizobium rhizogenes (strain K84 / ATCC BAA-868) TaxID=311403 RepID=B9JQC6_RHIR8|nr:ABC transporter permease [Rhizobium rhizogenes]ACM31345.1 ABC transporter permease protein [Rhizobium rhizogenes K84]OCJ22059.1 ABC transporter permease [Agrobacterium sp. B131/95]OCJ24424.1 ABC transporter permease [Agrobacterium sp. B133/95]NTI46293.1 ABC transporter permease [Rhizobium rhizogenes]NTI52976.1 ABC transporter permease [Rhizobium rhizogenes]